jgi:hypothetical protein
MKTSDTIRERFPVGTHIVTSDAAYVLKDKGVRTGVVVGYCDSDERDSDHYLRVRWDGWKEKSNVAVHAGRIQRSVNHSQFGFIVMVRDRGQDEPRRLPKIYKDHPAAICVKHNLQDTKRFNSVWVREAEAGELDLSEA